MGPNKSILRKAEQLVKLNLDLDPEVGEKEVEASSLELALGRRFCLPRFEYHDRLQLCLDLDPSHRPSRFEQFLQQYHDHPFSLLKQYSFDYSYLELQKSSRIQESAQLSTSSKKVLDLSL